jgi:hypothetical protein
MWTRYREVTLHQIHICFAGRAAITLATDQPNAQILIL